LPGKANSLLITENFMNAVPLNLQEARVTLLVIKYFAKSLMLIRNDIVE